MMFDFLYPGGEPRIKRNYLSHINNHVAYLNYQNKMFDLFKDYVRQTYIANQFKPIPLTPQEEQLYRAKLFRMVMLFRMGVPNRDNTLRYLEDTTGRVRSPIKKLKVY
jgi:hypothetical protein